MNSKTETHRRDARATNKQIVVTGAFDDIRSRHLHFLQEHRSSVN